MSDWEAFQRDVLDVVRQYNGYFNFFEQIGSLSDSSRPDCFTRVTREKKKEVWILDAKSKPEIDVQDRERMKDYIERLKSNPVDVGLDHAEMDEHEVRPMMVTPVDTESDEFRCIPFRELHQFLQKELVYTDTDRAVRELGKMVERGQLSHEQARLLHDSLTPYRKGINQLRTILNDIESSYAGAEASFSSDVADKYGIAVDAVLEHAPRSKIFLIDVPYNSESIEEVKSKKDFIQDRMETSSEEVLYAAVNRFESDSDILHAPEEFEEAVRRRSAAISARDIARFFEPQVPVQESFESGKCRLENQKLDFALHVETEDDVRHYIQADLPQKARRSLSEKFMNSQKKFGMLEDGKFKINLEITEDYTIRHSGTCQDIESFRQSVRELFLSSVSRSLAGKANGCADINP
ncbi:MAG: hypothetical protein ABEJ03_01940 [Candidatus Nanohaloarchaea archaeon]